MRIPAIAFAALMPGLALADTVEKTSPHSVADTADRLVAAIENAGATLFARVDHAAGASSIGMELPAAERIIFGNPQVGTPIMQEGLLAGLALPPSVLIYDDEGETKVIYMEVEELLDDLDVDDDIEAVGKLETALDNLTNAAIAD